MDTNPASEANNKHHTDTEIKTDAELLEELFGRGEGDPDVHGYPGDEGSDVE